MRFLASVVVASLCLLVSGMAARASSAPAQESLSCTSTKSDAELLAAEADFKKNRIPPSRFGLIPPSIPVYFHVIVANKTLKGGWITDAQIRNQIKVLNEDFATHSVRWTLVKINHVINPDWFLNVLNLQPQEAAMKTKHRIGGPGTLNVYTVGLKKRPSLLGFATFPEDYRKNPKDDGIVLRHSSLPGGNYKDHNTGKTLTHEAGHWVGLHHVFRGGCKGSNDFVQDTAAMASPSYGCPKSRNSCGTGFSLINNYMDYQDDVCKTKFTVGQGIRMRDRLRTYRGIKGI